MWRLGLISLVVWVSGCSSLDLNQKSPRELQLTRRWARDTLTGEYLGYKRMHRMEPLLTESLVIQGNAIDSISAFDRKSGHRIWTLALENGVEGGAQLIDGRIYFAASDGQFYCLEAGTGQILWTYPVRAEGLGEPLVREGRVYFLAGNSVFHVLDSETGKMIWTYSRPEASQFSIRGGSKPSFDGSNLYVGFSDGYLVSLSKDNGSVNWEALINRNKRFSDVDASPVIQKDRIYIPSYDGGIYCLDKATGKIVWSRDEGGFSAVTLDEDRLYFGASNGRVMALDLSSGKEIWSYKVKGLPTQPKLFRGLVIVGDSAGPVYALDARNGEFQNQFHPGLGVTSPVALDLEKNEAYFISADANLFALRVNWMESWKRWPWETKGEQ